MIGEAQNVDIALWKGAKIKNKIFLEFSNWGLDPTTQPPPIEEKKSKKSWSKNTLNHRESVLNQTQFLMLLAPLCLL